MGGVAHGNKLVNCGCYQTAYTCSVHLHAVAGTDSSFQFALEPRETHNWSSTKL